MQDTVRTHQNWDVWDVRDLSDVVRRLPADRARALVETHFGPYVRRAFLGLRGLAAFRTSEDFFSDLSHADRLFSHCWKLVGRKGVLEALCRFVGQDTQSVALLVGRGGIGKSRLLKEFAESLPSLHPTWQVLFVAEGVKLTADSMDELPQGPLVIALDDAHRADVDLLLALLRQRTDPTKLLFSARPTGADRLDSALSQGSIASE